MSSDSNERCMQCEKHCPKEELACGRGRIYFHKKTADTDYENEQHEERGHHRNRAIHEDNCEEDKNDLTYLLMRCGFILNHKCARNRGQGRILHLLREQPKMSQKELQEHLGIEAGSLSETLAKLETRGLIERQKAEEDKRKMIVLLTDKGRKELEDRFAKEKQNDELYRILEDAEKESLQKILVKLMDQWSLDHHEKERGMHHLKGHYHIEKDNNQ